MPPFVMKANKHKSKRNARGIQRRRKFSAKKHTLVAETNKFDIVGNLPPELAQTIFAQLNPSDLRNAVRTSRKWKDLIDEDYFWKHKCKIDNYPEVKETSRSKVYEKFVHKSPNYWERVYVYNQALHQNWIDNTFKETIFDFPRGTPRVHYFDDEILIMTNDSARIFVYNYSTEQFLQVFPLSENSFYMLEIIRKSLNFVVYFRKLAGLITVWCIDTGLCKLDITLEEDDGDLIKDVIVDKNLIAVLFCSGICHILNILSGKVEHRTKIEDLNCVCFHEGQVAFGTCGVINIMNWADKVITTMLMYGKEVTIRRIMISSDYLISFSVDDICVWSLQKKTKLNVLVSGDQSNIHEHALFSNSTTLLAVNITQDMLEAWDFIAGTLKFTIALKGDIRRVSIIMNDHYIFTYHSVWHFNPSTMKVWCKKTGKFLSNMTYNCKFTQPLVTNTKLTYMNACFWPSLHIQDFEKKINLRQLNSLYV